MGYSTYNRASINPQEPANADSAALIYDALNQLNQWLVNDAVGLSQDIREAFDAAQFWEKRYAIGDIFISDKEENPAVQMGGTWELLPENVTLAGTGNLELAQNNTPLLAGQLIGSDTVKLTQEHVPAHTHYMFGPHTDDFITVEGANRFWPHNYVLYAGYSHTGGEFDGYYENIFWETFSDVNSCEISEAMTDTALFSRVAGSSGLGDFYGFSSYEFIANFHNSEVITGVDASKFYSVRTSLKVRDPYVHNLEDTNLPDLKSVYEQGARIMNIGAARVTRIWRKVSHLPKRPYGAFDYTRRNEALTSQLTLTSLLGDSAKNLRDIKKYLKTNLWLDAAEWTQAQMDEAEVYKVGDVWVTENTEDEPATRFGGVWELIEARVLKNVGTVELPTFLYMHPNYQENATPSPLTGYYFQKPSPADTEWSQFNNEGFIAHDSDQPFQEDYGFSYGFHTKKIIGNVTTSDFPVAFADVGINVETEPGDKIGDFQIKLPVEFLPPHRHKLFNANPSNLRLNSNEQFVSTFNTYGFNNGLIALLPPYTGLPYNDGGSFSYGQLQFVTSPSANSDWLYDGHNNWFADARNVYNNPMSYFGMNDVGFGEHQWLGSDGWDQNGAYHLSRVSTEPISIIQKYRAVNIWIKKS